MTSINLNHLEAFCVLCETLNFSKAAKILKTSQPAISRKIKILESNLECELFLRNKSGISLTANGQKLQDRVLIHYKSILSVIKSGTQKLPTIRVGSIYEAGARILAPALASLIEMKVIEHFDLVFKPAEELVRMLTSGELDYIFIHYQPTQTNIFCNPVFRDEAILIGPDGFNLSREEHIPLITYRSDDNFAEDFLKKSLPRKLSKKFGKIASANSHLVMLDLSKQLNALTIIPLSSLEDQYSDEMKIYMKSKSFYDLYLCSRHNLIANNLNEYIFKTLAKLMSKSNS